LAKKFCFSHKYEFIKIYNIFSVVPICF
jgi:hypothetical protein